MIKTGNIGKIDFKFKDDKVSDNVFKGLRNFGPCDFNEREFDTIKLLTLTPSSKEKKVSEFLDRLSKVFKDFFLIENIENEIHIIDNIDDIYEDSLTEKPKEKNVRKIILHYHFSLKPKYWAPYYKIKRQFLGKGISTQGLLRDDLFFKGFYLNNVACGIYAKVGGRPWAINGTISNVLKEKTLYVGFDVSRKTYGKGEHPSPGCIVMYDESGQYVYHFTETMPISYEYMTEEVAKNLIEEIIGRFKSKKKVEPKNIVFMRDGDIHNSEIIGFSQAVEEREIDMMMIETRKIGNIPIFKRRNDKLNIADSGTYLSIENKDDQRPLDVFIQTLGPKLKLSAVPKAVKITPRSFKIKQVNIDDLARQITVLSHLNWSHLRGRTKLPITVQYAHEAALLMQYGIMPQNIDEMNMWMI